MNDIHSRVLVLTSPTKHVKFVGTVLTKMIFNKMQIVYIPGDYYWAKLGPSPNFLISHHANT